MSFRHSHLILPALLTFIACTSGAADQAPESSTPMGSIPCEVMDVLQRNCSTCHGQVPQFGAPMSLLNESDVHMVAKEPGHGNKQVFQRIAERIHGTTGESLMPPLAPNRSALSNADVAILDNWIGQGAPAGQSCMINVAIGSGGSTQVGSGGRSGAGGSQGTGGTYPQSAGGSGGSKIYVDAGQFQPPPIQDCTNIDITARADATGAPFAVPTGTSELYQCFSYHVDLKGSTQALSFHPLIQQTTSSPVGSGSPVIHHWLLYQALTSQTNGVSSACIGFHPDGVLLAGWAPGATDWNLPPTVGEEVGTGDFILEVHYNNYTGQNHTDQSGVRVCLANVPRQNVAGISWLGNDIFGGFGVPGIPPATPDALISGRCRPSLTGPVHIITSWPHMHKRGRRMTAVIDRAGGAVDPLFDVQFDFNSQWQYATPAVINAGDSILTTCHFDNTDTYAVSFGERTVDEMCFNFTLAYPAHTLIGGGLHANSCIIAP
jgi:hypothetical protein